MTLTLNIPSDRARADAEYRAKLRRAADALRDADLITEEQAAELAGPVETPPSGLRPPSEAEMAEWRAKLHQIGYFASRQTRRTCIKFGVGSAARRASPAGRSTTRASRRRVPRPAS